MEKSNGTHTTALRVWYENVYNVYKNAQGVKKNVKKNARGRG